MDTVKELPPSDKEHLESEATAPPKEEASQNDDHHPFSPEERLARQLEEEERQQRASRKKENKLLLTSLIIGTWVFAVLQLDYVYILRSDIRTLLQTMIPATIVGLAILRRLNFDTSESTTKQHDQTPLSALRILHTLRANEPTKQLKSNTYPINSMQQIAGASTAQDRLLQLARQLQLRANINLTLGVCIAIIGILTLATNSSTEISSATPQPSDAYMVAIQFIPRVSLLIVIEILALFFLRTYRSNIDDIKSTHNEITNIEMYSFAINLAKGSSAQTQKTCIECLMKIDRNAPMQTNQTTVALEIAKIENSLYKTLIETLKPPFGSDNKK